MILGVGLDICDIAQVAPMLDNEHFMRRVFSETERRYIQGKGVAAPQSLAGHFAAKEACVKAIGCGIVLPLAEVEVLHYETGAPYYRLSGQALARMQKAGGEKMHLSITHTNGMAAAVAILEGSLQINKEG